MYYKQSTKDIQLVILSFDDVMFNLTKLRYNYYRRLCKLYDSVLDKDSFMQHLGSYRTMFSDSPIDPALLNSESMVAKIEEDLLSYAKMYGLKHRDGLIEFMELLRQKNIKCVVTSTHPKKYTEPLYRVAALYHRPTEIVYDDDSIACLPDPSLYTSILNRYQLKPSQVLLVAANRNSVLAANKLRMNVIFIPGLEEPSKEMEIRCLKVVTSLLEIINILLEGGRISELSDQYLLIRHDGATQDLYQNYQHLLEVYRSDPEVLNIIEPIYQEEFSKAQKVNVEATLQEQEKPQETQENKPDSLSVLASLEETLKDESPHFDTINVALSNQKAEIEATPIKEEISDTAVESEHQNPHSNPLEDMPESDGSFTLDSLEENHSVTSTKPLDESLLKMIDTLSENEVKPVQDKTVSQTKIFTKDELKMLGIKEKDLLGASETSAEILEEEEANQPALLTSFFVNIGYALIDAILLTMVGGIAMIALDDWISKPQSVFHFVYMIFAAIGNLSIKVFSSLTDQIANIFNTSEMFSGCLAVILFLTVILWILLDISSIINKQRSKH